MNTSRFARRYLITLACDNGLSVTGLRGADAPPTVQSGYGGWTVITRPKRIGATQWDGRDPLRLDIPLLFDEWQINGLIEDDCITLERMAGLDGKKPPVVNTILGNVPHKELDYVIENLSWGSNVIYSSNGRQRQDVVVHLLEKIDDAIISAVSTRPGVPSIYVWQKGDSLQRIAVKFYGDIKEWQAIADYNNIRDPANIKAGTKISLP